MDLAHREKMQTLEDAIFSQGKPVEMECNHHFSHGLYTRELHIPAGVVITGAIHRYSNVNILTKGTAIAVTDEGRMHLEAPHTFVSGELVKKAIYAVTDVIWINVLPWDKEESVEMVEQEYVIPTYDLLDKEMQMLDFQEDC